MSSPTKPGSINARGGYEEVPRAVNNLINNQPGKRPSASSTRETSPLVTVSGGDSNGLERDGRRRLLSRVMQLLGVALLVAAGVFGFLALRKSHSDTVPFPTVSHPLKPSASWGMARRPYPTGAWWLNLMLEKGEQNVGVLPYAVRATADKGIEVSYSRWRHLSSNTVEADLFAPDVVLRSVEEASERTLEAYDPLSVTLLFKTSGKTPQGDTPFYRAPLVRGSPYITVEYHGCTPNVTNEFPITTINGLLMHDNNPLVLPTLSGQVFECTIISGQVWLLFASSPITFTWTPKGLVASAPFNGYLRAAFVPDPAMKPLLLQHWQAYPTGGRVLLDYNSDNKDDMITVQWRKKGSGDEKLLMLALPHHVEVLQTAQTMTFDEKYMSMKGAMTLVVGDRWFLKEKVPAIRWTAPRKIQDPAKLSLIKTSLPKDVYRREKGDKASGEDLDDPYWAGKDMSRLARLALIADELGMHDESMRAIKLAEEELAPWLEGSNSNPLVYDQVWGGLIVKNVFKDPYQNFGNGYYNDHHFQYGYFIYAAAVIAKLDPAWAAKYRAQLDSLVSDVVNYRDDSPHFPMARHKDFYDGHSWASGLFVQNNGKSQESSSEAINCYYGATLYGEAVGDHELKRFAGLLLSMEIRSTKWYWHMRTNDTVYDADFASNKMVGVVGATDATCHTWFGTKFEYVHGINFMPFTPITEAYLDKEYVEEEYPLLSTVLTRAVGGEDGPVDETWKGFVYLDHAILEPNVAWNEVLSLRAFDSGNSLTNSLYWVATRPNAGPSPLVSPAPAPLPPLSPGPEIIPSTAKTNASSTAGASAHASAPPKPDLKLKLDGGLRRARRGL